MLLIKNLNELHGQFQRVSLALGTFDGVHLAHRYVIRRTVEWSQVHEGTSMVFTFSNHPLSLIHPDRVPPMLQTAKGKNEQICKLGVQILVNVPFTKELLHLPPDDFVRLLAMKIKPGHIVVGPNYSFGDKGIGTPELLRELAGRYGIETEVCHEVYEDGVMVSSTFIRRLISGGEMERAAHLLGRPYELAGVVVQGDHRGKTLGFPTANLKVASNILLPGKGVYAVKIKVGSKFYNGLCNVGINPTFSVAGLRVEAHILNFDGDIYGKRISVFFLGRLRVEKAFSSVEALVQQMHCDLKEAQERFFH